MSLLFMVRITDRPEQLAVREKYLPEHKSWLTSHSDQVRAAGILRNEPNGASLGACWIVAASSRSEVQQLLHSDPFYQHGLRKEFEILHWSRGFPPGPATI